jgi:phage nucleotide-binding protein
VTLLVPPEASAPHGYGSDADYDPFPDELKPASELVAATGLNIVIFGQPGCGKTTLIGTATEHPQGRDVVIADFDNGLKSLRDRADIRGWPMNSFDEAVKLYSYLTTKRHPFRTIGLDSLSEAYRIQMTDVLRNPQRKNTRLSPDQNDYGEANEGIIRMARAFKDLAITHGYNIVMTAHQREDQDATTGAVLIRPSLTPGALLGVVGAVDALGYLRIKNGQRELLLQEQGNILAKYRQPRSGPQLPLVIQNPSLGPIIAHLRGEYVPEIAEAPRADPQEIAEAAKS